MKLYEINMEIEEIAEQLENAYSWQPELNERGEPVDGNGDIITDVDAFRNDLIEAWKETLYAVGEEFNEKVGNVAAYIKSLTADCKALDEEKKALEKRKKAKEKTIDFMEKYLIESLQLAGKKKVDTTRALVTWNEGRESVKIDNENTFIEWAKNNDPNYLKFGKPTIDKTAIKNAIKGGETIEGAQLVKTPYVTIK